MKALSVRQPMAALLCEGLKTIEVRSWATSHRGELLICATASPGNVFWHTEENDARMLDAGCLIGIVNLIDCRPMRRKDTKGSMSEFDPTAYSWHVRANCWCRPIHIAGRLNLFDVPDALVFRLDGDRSGSLQPGFGRPVRHHGLQLARRGSPGRPGAM